MFQIAFNVRESMCSSRKIGTHATEGHWKFPGGRGVLKVKVLEAKYEAKLEFPGGWEVQNITLK